eukprot:COSAG01_NODE_1356_length_10592_cov_4.971995_1_plen_52_part_10
MIIGGLHDGGMPSDSGARPSDRTGQDRTGQDRTGQAALAKKHLRQREGEREG